MRRVMLLILCILLVSCSSTPPPPQQPQAHVSTQKTTTEAKLYKEVQWQEWGDVALLRARIKHRPIAVYFYEEGCGFCDMMDATTFNDPAVVKLLNERFIPVKSRGLENPNAMDALFDSHAIFPALAFLGPDGTLLVSVNGYVPPANYRKALETIVEAMK